MINNDDDNVSVWAIPDVEEKIAPKNDTTTNAMGLKKTWRYEPPDEIEIEAPKPLTAEEIENIRQAAVDEGFNQGKEDGFEKGFAEGKAEGFKQGETKGFEEGETKGLAEGKEQIDNLTQQWKNLVEQLHKPLDVVEKNVEEQLFQLVVQLTEAVVLQEAKTDPDILMSAISAGIKALPSQESQTQIHLHPDDIAKVEDAYGSEHIQSSGWRLLPAPQLEPGSCQIENSTSNIDLRIKTRLKEVLEPFLQSAIHQ